jgi:N-acetylglutamate synthase-like GNAT family acetyltransferase
MIKGHVTEHPLKLDIVDDASAADIVRLEAHLDAFNAQVTRLSDARFLSMVLKDANGEIFAGLHGHTWGAMCEIKLLWVAQPHRKRGLGMTMLKAAEAEASRRGCRQIMLMTHSFQAPDFYEQHGFERIVTVTDSPVGHTDILMIKRL